VLPDGSHPALPASLNAHSWVLADLDTGAILAACAPHELHPPASTQKLLNILTALPRVNPNQTVTVTAGDLAFESGSSAVGLVEGGRYKISTLELGLLLVSGNDAANVLARLSGGKDGVKGGIAAMNAEAARLGAADTHAVTPSGLDGPGQWSSAYDLALIAKADFARSDFQKLTATKSVQIPAQRPNVQPVKTYKAFQIQNDNQLIYDYPGALGGKTGYTDYARHTYVGAAQRNGRRLVVTMMDGEHRPQAEWQQAAELMNWGFALPATTEPVGHLVDPGEAPAAAGTHNADAAQAAKVAPASPNDGPSAYFVGAAIAGIVLLVGAVAVLRARQQARARARRRQAHRLPYPVGPAGRSPRPRREPDPGPAGRAPRPVGRPPARYGSRPRSEQPRRERPGGRPGSR
jgi:D-alanyl-D-alanine carboxypeptidase (penicillin-binding protein 5/6)